MTLLFCCIFSKELVHIITRKTSHNFWVSLDYHAYLKLNDKRYQLWINYSADCFLCCWICRNKHYPMQLRYCSFLDYLFYFIFILLILFIHYYSNFALNILLLFSLWSARICSKQRKSEICWSTSNWAMVMHISCTIKAYMNSVYQVSFCKF